MSSQTFPIWSAGERTPLMLPESQPLIIVNGPFQQIEQETVISPAFVKSGAPLYVFVGVNVVQQMRQSQQTFTRLGPIVSSEIYTLPPVLSALDALAAEGEDEERPSEYAYKKARSIIEAAFGLFVGAPSLILPEFPQPVVSTDSQGGIRTTWRRGGKHLRANFGASADLRSYLYHESDTGEHDVEDLDPLSLAAKLHWLVS